MPNDNRRFAGHLSFRIPYFKCIGGEVLQSSCWHGNIDYSVNTGYNLIIETEPGMSVTEYFKPEIIKGFD